MMINDGSDKADGKAPADDEAAKAAEPTPAEPTPAEPSPAEAEPAALPEAAIDDAPARIVELEAQLAELKDQYLRALAETENVRRRSRRQMEEMRKYAAADLAKDLLSVADNLRRALESVPQEELGDNPSLAKFVGGLEAIERDFLQAFKAHHIVKLDPSGQVFDPNLHQAMMRVDNSGRPAGTVVQLMQVGYILRDRLLRPAMVGVAKGDDEEPPKVDTTA